MKLIGYIYVLRKFKKYGKSILLFLLCKQRLLINKGINNISVVVLTHYHLILSCYRPQTKFGARKYFHKCLSFCPWGGGMHGWRWGWEVVCVAEGMCGRGIHSQGAYVTGGVHGKGSGHGGGMHCRGCVEGEGVCIAGG